MTEYHNLGFQQQYYYDKDERLPAEEPRFRWMYDDQYKVGSTF